MQVLIGTPAEVVEVLNGLEKIEEKQKSKKDPVFKYEMIEATLGRGVSISKL